MFSRRAISANERTLPEANSSIADALISTAPKADLVKQFEKAGSKGKPRYGQVTVCYAANEDDAARTVSKHWPNAGIDAPLMTDLPLPGHFEKVIEVMQPDKITEDVVLGPEPRKHIAAIKSFIDAGFDHVYVHQTGPNQEPFFRFYQEKVLPHFVQMQGARTVLIGQTARAMRMRRRAHREDRSVVDHAEERERLRSESIEKRGRRNSVRAKFLHKFRVAKNSVPAVDYTFRGYTICNAFFADLVT